MTFQRQVLVQALVIINFLMSFHADEKARLDQLRGAKTLKFNFVLDAVCLALF